jgi:ketosteroid isomerase-like protein
MAMTPAEAIDGVFGAWQRLAVDELVELFTDDARYEDPLFPEPLVGKEQLRESIGPAMAELNDCAITTRRVAGDGDAGMVEAEFRSSLASGEGRLDFDFAMVVEMDGGRVARLAEYFDTRPLG